MQLEAYLGLDGGGSNICGQLFDSAGDLLATSTADSGNANQTTPKTLLARMQKVISECLQTCDQTVRLKAACIGLAGCGSPEIYKRTVALLKEIHPQPTFGFQLKTDAEIALSGAFLDRPGMLLIAGTGSICFAKDAKGDFHRNGGHGPESDDLGSGAWIGRQAIRMSQKAFDSPICNVVLAHFGCSTLEALDSALKSPNPDQNKQIAALCPIICDLHRSNDPSATQIINSAAEALVELIRGTHQKSQRTNLAFAGSLLTQNTPIQTLLLEKLAIQLPFIQVKPAVLDPLRGATLLAYRSVKPESYLNFAHKLTSQKNAP